MNSSAVESESFTNNILAWAAPFVSTKTSGSQFYIGAPLITNFTQDPFLPSLLIPEISQNSPTLDILESTTTDIRTIEHLETAATFSASTEPAKPKMKRKISDVYLLVWGCTCIIMFYFI